MKNCLIVDDSRVIRKVSRHIVETLGFTVDEAADGQEALAKCDSRMPDVILLDWNMPVMSGIEFLAKLRERPNGKRPSWSSARPKTTSPISAKRSTREPTNTS